MLIEWEEVNIVKAKEIVSYIHQNMDLTFRPEDEIKCHAAILKDWSRNDAFLNEDFNRIGALRIKYDDEIEGFHDLVFSEERFLKYIEKAEQDEEEDVYFSINSYWKMKRSEEDIRHLNAFVIDYDYYKLNEYKDYTAQDMYEKYIHPSLQIEPTFVIDSGRGLYCIFCIQHTPYQCSSVYKAIYGHLVASQTQFGADAKASLTTQVIRIPGSLNGRSGHLVKLIEHTDIRYTIPGLAEIFLPYSREEVKEYKRKKANNRNKKKNKTSKKGIRLKSTLSQLEEDLIKLIDLRNTAGIHSGYRETLLYLYWERAQKLEMNEKAIHKKILWLNSLFAMPLRNEEALKRCKPAKNYQYVTCRSKMMKKLEITEEEQCHLSFLVFEKRCASIRQKKSRKKDKVMGRSKAAHKRFERRKAVLIGFSQGKCASKIASELDVVKKTILADCKYIQSHVQEFSKLIQAIKKSWINQYGKTVTNLLIKYFKETASPMWNFLN